MSGFAFSKAEPQILLSESELVTWLDDGVILCGLHHVQVRTFNPLSNSI
jgi:hypothetical protein